MSSRTEPGPRRRSSLESRPACSRCGPGPWWIPDWKQSCNGGSSTGGYWGRGDQLPFDAENARALERKIIEHTGYYAFSTARARADASHLDRTELLARTTVPTLAVSAPAEPVFPPPHPHHLAQAVRGARVAEIPGMGHALQRDVHAPLAAAILEHTLGASPHSPGLRTVWGGRGAEGGP